MGRVILSGIVPTLKATVHVDPVLNNNSWETISKISQTGLAAQYWNVGDTKDIVINGTVGDTTFTNLTVQAFIIGIDHNAAREGEHLIHFQIGKIGKKLVALYDTSYGGSSSGAGVFTMNTAANNAGGWGNSHMRKIILGSDSPSATSPTANTLLAALPTDLRAVMKPATKYSDNTGGGKNEASYVTGTTDLLPLLSEFENHGDRRYANSAEQNYQAQYDYYKAGNGKIHYRHDGASTAVRTWCRSVSVRGSRYFCEVDARGTASNQTATSVSTLSPCFFV